MEGEGRKGRPSRIFSALCDWALLLGRLRQRARQHWAGSRMAFQH